MGFLKLQDLELTGFRSFAEASSVSFPDHGLVLINGKNLDTGGSSGSGKSSLILALSYTLGYCPFAATDLASWQNDGQSPSVIVRLKKDETEFEIKRGKKLEIKINGTSIQGSAKLLQERLEHSFGLTSELLKALTYRQQKQPGLFLSKTDSEKKEFLTTLLGLEKFEYQYEKSKIIAKELQEQSWLKHQMMESTERSLQNQQETKPLAPIDDLKRKVASLTQSIEEKKQQLANYHREVADLRQKIESQCAGLVASHLAEISRSEEEVRRIEEIRDNLKKAENPKLKEKQTLLSNLLKLKQELLEKDLVLEADWQEKTHSLQNSIETLAGEVGRIPELKRTAEKLAHEIEATERNVCPTCSRQWDEAKDLNAKLQGQLEATKNEISSLEGSVPRLQELRDTLKQRGSYQPDPNLAKVEAARVQLLGEIEDLKTDALEEIQKADDAFRDAELAVANLKVKLQKELEIAKANLTESHQDWLYEKMDALSSDIRMRESECAGVKAQLEQTAISNARIEAYNQQLVETRLTLGKQLEQEKLVVEEIDRKLHAEKDFLDLIGREGFLGSIFDEVLEEISEETNKLLSRFPNTAHVALEFQSETLTQKGTTKRSIVPVITVGGHQVKLEAGLSGGMGTAVELAVDLAMSAVISRRTGIVPGWLVLDESFTGLGPVETEACMEILQEYSEDRLILVIDHSSELKSMFTDTIEVLYENGVSRIEP